MHEILLRSYRLDLRPVTNGDFVRFVDAGGYQEPYLWSPAGRRWLQRSSRRVPKFWGSPRWRQWCDAERPVVGVTYYEAEAYARFRSGRLPTEDEWEQVAGQGTGIAFPWGDQFDRARANTSEHWFGRSFDSLAEWRTEVVDRRLWREICMTTPVGAFPSGSAPTGHMDLAGNVWEWCDSADTAGRRVVRGGSFAYMGWNARADERGLHNPWWASLGIGFRCAADDV